MSKINNYGEFINEEFFKKILGRKKPTIKKDRIESCVEEIITFLSDNGIHNWSQFVGSRKFDKDTINKLIDHSAKNMDELKEIRFRLRLELSNTSQLREYLKELESDEEYEKCTLVLKKINNR